MPRLQRPHHHLLCFEQMHPTTSPAQELLVTEPVVLKGKKECDRNSCLSLTSLGKRDQLIKKDDVSPCNPTSLVGVSLCPQILDTMDAQAVVM